MLKSTRTHLLVILLLAVLLRVSIALLMGDHVVELPGIQDQISYHALALRLLGGHGFSFDAGWHPFTTTAAYPLSWPTARYRVPTDACLMPLAALALIDLYTRVTARRHAKAAKQTP